MRNGHRGLNRSGKAGESMRARYQRLGFRTPSRIPTTGEISGRGRRRLSAALIALGFLAVGGAVYLGWEAQKPKVGYFDSEALRGDFAEVVRARQEVKSLDEQWRHHLEEMRQSIKELEKKLESQTHRLSADDRRDLEFVLAEKRGALARQRELRQSSLASHRSRLFGMANQKFALFVNYWAEKHGFDKLFMAGKRDGMPMGNGARDVTDRLRKDMLAFSREYGSLKSEPGTSAD